MGSASEHIQDPSANEMSKVNAFTDNALSLDVGLQCVTSVPSKDQFISGNDYAPKVRKPYTISKQRERWTEEDHKKFLEALKLYGRAWKHIEEHVGTKTAVQIRSHAQKFFSKVVRESNSSEESIVKPIEIPPPRPKRKPVHPYPRKIVSPVKTGPRLPDEHTRSVSPNSSISGQENQSPTSVLSAFGSNTTGVTDSNMLDCSLSPASFPSETILSPEEYGSENGSSSPTQENGCSAQDEQVEVPMKLELFSEDSALVKEGSSEAVSTRSLKLFGKTVIVSGPSSPNSENCNSQLFEVSEERPVETSCNIKPEVRFTPNDAEHAWTSSSCGASAVYYMQFLNGVLYPFLQLHNPVPEKGYEYSDFNEVQDKELQNDGSRTGSNTGSANVGSAGDKTWDVETHSGLPFVEEVALPETRKSPVKSVKGFVPYKRCLAERDNGSTLKGKERDERRIRLSL